MSIKGRAALIGCMILIAVLLGGFTAWLFQATTEAAMRREAGLKERYDSFFSSCTQAEPQYECEYKWRMMWRR